MKPLGIVALLITLSACAPQQKLTQTQCVAEPFSWFYDTTGNRARITVAKNGSPCVINLSGARGGSFGLEGQLARQPAHGTAYMQAAADVTRIVYTPERDF